MAEANIFFLPAKEVCRRQVITCAPDDPLDEVAARMRQHNISSLVVCEGGAPTGIVTDRDLRNKVVAAGLDPRATAVRSVMNSPLIAIDEDAPLFEALYRMSRHGIHRVGVVDGSGSLVGIVTDSDVLRLQARSPQQMVREIAEAASLDDLRRLHERVQDLVVHLSGTGAAARDLVRLIAYLNDQIVLRLIALLRAERFNDLPQPFSFIVLGSEGRREQTLTTDQDNALIYGDDLSADEIDRLRTFARELIDSLISIGVPACPGGIMAKNDAWCRSLSGWVDVLDHWLSVSTPENILNGSMFFDLRTVYGDPSLERAIKEHAVERLGRETAFLMRMAGNVLRFVPPLGWFGRIKAEKLGEHRGAVDVKKAGIFAITEGVKVLALEAGILDGGTHERMQALAAAGLMGQAEAADLAASFDFLVLLRLRGQVAAIREGREPNNFIPLDHLNRMESGRLRLALEGVKTFQGFLQRHFRLDQVL